MNLEELISKYIDGELSQDEDRLFRSKVNENELSREKFDAAVNLHLAFMEDARSITPPEDLVRRTEDAVLMRILSEEPELERPLLYNWSRVPAMAALIAAFMFLSLFKISDLYSPKKNGGTGLFTNVQENFSGTGRDASGNLLHKSASSSALDLASEDVGNKIFQKNIASTGNNEDKKNKSEAGGQAALSNITLAATPVQEELIVAQGENEDFSVSESNNDIEAGNIRIIEPIAELVLKNEDANYHELWNFQENNQKFPALVKNEYLNVLPQFSLYSDFGQPSEIQVTSFFGTDIVREGIDTKKNSTVSHFSQSIAYAMNNTERLGLEIGYTEYQYRENTSVSVPLRTYYTGTTVEVFEPLPNNTGHRDEPFSFNMNKQIFWGSVFYESSLYRSNSFTMNGRFGIGTSSEGPLGYGRLFAQYSLFGGFSFTLGADGRLFVAELPKLIKTQSNWKATVTLIYGFQFNF